MKPPVEAPASRARRPSTATAKPSRAASSFSPPRPTKRGGSPRMSTGSPGATRRAGLVAMAPPTVTLPASIRAWACWRESTRPRRTSSASSRRRAASYLAAGFLAAGFLAAGFAGGRLPGRGLPGRRLLRRLLDGGDALGQGIDIGLCRGLDLDQLVPDLGADPLGQRLARLAGALDQVLHRGLGVLGPDLTGLDEILDDLFSLLPGHLGVGHTRVQVLAYDIDGSHGVNAIAVPGERPRQPWAAAQSSARPSSTSHSRATVRGSSSSSMMRATRSRRVSMSSAAATGANRTSSPEAMS